jgi:Flp pilus assembly protein TadD
MTPEERGEKVYDLYRRGSDLLEHGDFSAAAIPLEKARELEPEKSSIREAGEFQAVVDRHPVNDFAHFCLGRSLEKSGRRREARKHLALAASLRPERADYRIYRDRLRRAA